MRPAEVRARTLARPFNNNTYMDGQDQPRATFDVESATAAQPLQRASSTPSVDWSRALVIFFFPALGGLLYGYDIGASSGALVSLTSPSVSGTTWYALTPFQTGMVVSASLFGALVGSILAFGSANFLGRRGELLVAALLFGLGSLGTMASASFSAVLAARCVYGCGIGYGMHAAPAYIAETAPASARGLFISLKEALVVLGILLGYGAGFAWIDAAGGWRSMYGAAILPALALAVGMAWLPESPRWILLAGKGRARAAAALARVQGAAATKESVARELAETQAALEAGDTLSFDELSTPTARYSQGRSHFSSVFGSLAELTKPRYHRPLQIGVSLMLFQQITGQPSVLYYAASIFQAAGFRGSAAATGISVILGGFKLIMTALAVGTVDRLGRRPLLLWGVGALVGSLFVLSFASTRLVIALSQTAAAWMSLVALLLYVGCYQVSFGPLSWLVVSEIFPLRVRGQAIAVATFTNFASNFVVSLLLPSVREAIGPSATYFLFGVIGCVAVHCIDRLVPETKGKTLEEIEMIWAPR